MTGRAGPTAAVAAPAAQRWRRAEADRVIDWALGSLHPAGGFAWRGDDGRPVPEAGRPLWINCRMVHCLALGHLIGRTDCTAALDAGLAALGDGFADAVHGGYHADADRPGTGPKEAYGHAFVVLAASSATVAGRPDAAALLDAALGVVEARFWDEATSMPFDAWDAAFTRPDPYRGANAAMHLVEAFLAAADAGAGSRWRDRAAAICSRIVAVAGAAGWRIPEHYDRDWLPLPDYNREAPRDRFRPFGVTPGHALEWSRLLLALRAADPTTPATLDGAAVALATTAVADGWDPVRGGFVYTTDLTGATVVADRFHWVACEAVAAATALAAATGEAVWAERAEAWWAWIRRHLVDPTTPGGWRHELDADNRAASRTWSGRPDSYHALQALLLPDVPAGVGIAEGLRRRRDGA